MSRFVKLARGYAGRLFAKVVALRGRRALMRLNGIIHIGANSGQERDGYARYGLKVIWIEPIPSIFKTLQNAIAAFPDQRALEYLVLDRDGERKTLHVASNDRGSSSVLDMALHREVWPGTRYTHDIALTAYRLDTIVDREKIELSDYDGLVLDTQGSELLILQGADRVLRRMKMVKVEVADFEMYAGCPRPADIARILAPYGLHERIRQTIARDAAGRCYEITYLKR